MMKNLKKIILVLMIFPFSSYTQTLQSTSRQTVKIKDDKQNLPVTENSVRKRTSSAYHLSFFKQKRNKNQQKQLLPNTDDLNRFAAFLQQPKTGIIRLTEDVGCEPSRYIIRADEECLKSIPGGSFYSFREREYSSSALADLRLKDGLLISDGAFSQNILVKLGDIPLENISLASDGMKFLTEFLPELDVKDATRQYIGLTRGIKVGKFKYVKVFPAFADNTYAMRLVAYKAEVLRFHQGFTYNLLSDDRSDLVLAFRIVRKDDQGIVILWKELARKKSFKLNNANVTK